jgi:hypothetical protein
MQVSWNWWIQASEVVALDTRSDNSSLQDFNLFPSLVNYASLATLQFSWTNPTVILLWLGNIRRQIYHLPKDNRLHQNVFHRCNNFNQNTVCSKFVILNFVRSLYILQKERKTALHEYAYSTQAQSKRVRAKVTENPSPYYYYYSL